MISAGPFPLMALVALLALAIGWFFARALAPAADGMRSRAGAVVLDAFLLGLLGARLGHVALHAGDYLPQPLSIIRLGDGGYSIWAGLLVAAAYARSGRGCGVLGNRRHGVVCSAALVHSVAGCGVG